MGMEAFATALFVGATVGQVQQQREAEKDRKRAADRAEKARRNKEARERRQQVRQMILARSEAEIAGVATGAGGRSSGVMGAMDNVTSTAGGNLAFSINQGRLRDEIFKYSEKARKHSINAGYLEQVGQLGFKAASMGMNSGPAPSAGGTSTVQGTTARADFNRSMGRGGY